MSFAINSNTSTGFSITLGSSPTGQIKVYDGTIWVAKPVKVWDESVWVVKPLKFWDGSVWVTTPY